MTRRRASLRGISTAVLEQLREGLARGVLRPPVDQAALVGFGIRHQLDELEGALGGHKTAACIAVLDVALAERALRRPAPELVWTGPEAPASTARDTAVVLRALFEEARERVLLAGYTFDHAADVLAPLHASMRDYGVETQFFVDVPQPGLREDAAAHLRHHLRRFLKNNWPFGAPCPRLYYDKRSLMPGPPYHSLHAKCVVVDGAKAFVSSANFTQRGQARNIEVGVLIEDQSFANFLSAQWNRLIDGGLIGEFFTT